MKKIQETALTKYCKDNWGKFWVYEDCNVITDYCSAVRLPAEYKVEEVKQRYVPELPELIAKQFKRANNKYEYETIKTLTKDELKSAGKFYQFNDKYAVDGKRLRKLFDAVGGAVKRGAEHCDVTIRCYLIGNAINSIIADELLERR